MQSHVKVLTSFELNDLVKIFNNSNILDFNGFKIKNPSRKETRRRLRWILENPKCVYCYNEAKICKIEQAGFKIKTNCFINNCKFCFNSKNYYIYQQPNIQIYSQYDVLMTIDHVIPKSRGGMRGVSNWQTCCVLCNQYKGSAFF